MMRPLPKFQDPRLLQQFASLALLSAMCMGMLLARVMWTGRGTYGFLAWNLFLAWIPIGLSTGLDWLSARRSPLLLVVGTLGAWLLFLPNAPYILTDLVHLKPRTGVPYWYDIVMVAAYAFTGLLLGFHSLAQVQGALLRWLRPLYAWGATLAFSLGAAYGIYLGRVQRWNSWDILRDPLRLAKDCLAPVYAPMEHKQAIGMTLMLGAFLMAGYLVYRFAPFGAGRVRE